MQNRTGVVCFWLAPLVELIKFGRRKQWHPTPVLLPGKSHGQRSLGLQCMCMQRVGHNWATSLSLFTFMHWRRKWQPTLVFLPGEPQGWCTLVGCHLWGSHRVRHNWSDLSVAAAAIKFGTGKFYHLGNTFKRPGLTESCPEMNSVSKQ